MVLSSPRRSLALRVVGDELVDFYTKISRGLVQLRITSNELDNNLESLMFGGPGQIHLCNPCQERGLIPQQTNFCIVPAVSNHGALVLLDVRFFELQEFNFLVRWDVPSCPHGDL